MKNQEFVFLHSQDLIELIWTNVIFRNIFSIYNSSETDCQPVNVAKKTRFSLKTVTKIVSTFSISVECDLFRVSIAKLYVVLHNLCTHSEIVQYWSEIIFMINIIDWMVRAFFFPQSFIDLKNAYGCTLICENI